MSNHLTPERFAYRLQFSHIGKRVAEWPGAQEVANLAAIYGIGADEYRRIESGFAANARGAAEMLLADSVFAERVGRLPFRKGAVVVGLGDSITDDWQSWLEILRHLLALHRPHDGIRLVNAGVSGDTTTQMLARFLGVVQLEPDWVICLAGTNDARLHGLKPIKPLVSVAETAANLAALRNFAATQAPRARWIWMTPPTVIEEAISRHWFLGEQNQLGWRNADLVAIADVMKRQPDPVVDLQRVFGLPPQREYLLDDGLHPSLEGQKAIVRALVEQLT